MTLLDFRSGGHQGARGSFARSHHDDTIDDWHPDDDWAAGRMARQAASERLTDQDSLLGRAARLTHYLGALVSVTLMISLGVWGYQLVVRDVSGVPVIRAVEGEARIVPDEPGGKLSDRTGLAVNEIAGGAEPSAADKVAIAPAPTALDGQDVAMGELGATARQSAVVEEPVPAPTEAAIVLSDAEAAARTAEAQEAARVSGVPAVAPGETDATPVTAAVTTVDGLPTQDTAIHIALAEAGVQPPVAAARPAPRPRRIAAAASAGTRTDAAPANAALIEAVPEPQAEPEAKAEPVKTAKVAAGAPLVQIGAFDSDGIAQSEWSRISGRFGALFAGKAPVVQKHQANGRTFYRLRIAGFESREDARRFCAALIEAGTDCIPAAAK